MSCHFAFCIWRVPFEKFVPPGEIFETSRPTCLVSCVYVIIYVKWFFSSRFLPVILSRLLFLIFLYFIRFIFLNLHFFNSDERQTPSRHAPRPFRHSDMKIHTQEIIYTYIHKYTYWDIYTLVYNTYTYIYLYVHLCKEIN